MVQSMAAADDVVCKVLRHGGPVTRDGVIKLASLTPEAALAAIRTGVRGGTVRWLPDARSGWLASAPAISARVPASMQRLLTVSGPLPLRVLRASWRRQQRLKGFVALP